MITTARQNNGRFALGNAGGPGRPPIAKERAYLETLTETCSIDDWQEICRRAVKDAKAGDYRARDWLTKFLIGEPPAVGQVLHGHLHAGLPATENAYANADSDAVIGALVALARLRESSRNNEG